MSFNISTESYAVYIIEKKMENLCRICLQEPVFGVDLASEGEDSKKALEKIYLCFQIVLNFQKYLPNKICENCMLELNMANSFRLKCISFEERFEIKLKQVSTNQQSYNNINTLQENENIIEIKLTEETISSNQIDETNDPVSPYINTESEFTSADKYLLENEMENTFNYKCEICAKILKSKTSLLKHKTSMHKKRKHIGKVIGFGSARRYLCTSCSYSTPHSQTLVNHMRRHNGERPYKCECGKTFTQSSSLAAHQKTHSNATYFTCSICGKQFKHAFTLKNHLRVHENGTLMCNICQKVLKSKQTLKYHMQRHFNIRNYNCEDCGDVFVTSSELLSHRKKHSTEKAVECHLCQYKTRTKKNLIIHLKRHAGIKTFKCNICEVTFCTGGELQCHQRVHSREKTFSCPTCAQQFAHSSSLNKHMRTVHGLSYKWGDFKRKENENKKIPYQFESKLLSK